VPRALGNERSRLARPALLCLLITVALCSLRLSHINLLWADEDYHIAAALQIIHGKIPYCDFWYDKPPLSAFYYLLIAGYSGWPLRLLDGGYALTACYLAYRLARIWWSETEGYVAALLLAFFLTFYLPSAVIPFAADALMLVPHLAAIYCARCGRSWSAGVWTGIAFLANTKALFVLLTCAIWLLPELLGLAVGFLVPVLAAAFCALITGAWTGYIEQVWRWGLIYARDSPVLSPLRNGFLRTVNWAGFHAAVVIAAFYGLVRMTRTDRQKLGVWIILSFAAVSLGSRFAPHYFLQLLPSLVIAGSRGIVLAFREFRRPAAISLGILLFVPLVRFGPRYASLALDNVRGVDPQWSDVAMDLDSQQAARELNALKKPADTLFVWGYRPDLYVYTRLTPPGRFWDSQPLTGVPADRHLNETHPIYSGPAAANRQALLVSHPTWIVDGLGLLNPKLRPDVYPELRLWLSHYQLIGRTKLSLIYQRRD